MALIPRVRPGGIASFPGASIMNGNTRSGGIPGAGSEEPPEPYSWRARLGFVIGGVVVLGYPVWLWYYESRSGHVAAWWAMAGMWWTIVAGCVLTVALAKMVLRSSRHS
jgi:hypothetical protein